MAGPYLKMQRQRLEFSIFFVWQVKKISNYSDLISRSNPVAGLRDKNTEAQRSQRGVCRHYVMNINTGT